MKLFSADDVYDVIRRACSRDSHRENRKVCAKCDSMAYYVRTQLGIVEYREENGKPND